MIEITYIPLKTQEGRVVGHARVQNGHVDVRLKGSTPGGQALVLTENGQSAGSPDTRIRVNGNVRAVAVHAEGRVLCAGGGSGNMLSFAEIQRSVGALLVKRADAPRANDTLHEKRGNPPADFPVDAAFHAAPPEKSARETRAEEAAPETEIVPMRRSIRHTHSEPSVQQVLTALSKPEVAEFLPPEQGKSEKPVILPAIADDDEARSATFAALLERADAVFRRISEPYDDEETMFANASFENERKRADESGPAKSAQTEPPQPAFDATEPDTWSRAVEDMLSACELPADREVENPFPHIFPGARFVDRGTEYGGYTLLGEWEQNGENLRITAVRGEYSPQPPEELPGFTRYIRTLQGGFWVRVDEGEHKSRRIL